MTKKDTDFQWSVPDRIMIPVEDEVHVWRVEIEDHRPSLDNLYSILSTTEQKRADRYYFEKDRERSIISRGLLRTLLGTCLEKRPEEILFHYNPFGKPYLREGFRDSTLQFNVSHSKGMVMFAITWGRNIGIDVEAYKPNLKPDEIARRFFAPGEVRNLLDLSDEMRQEGFFNCWTRKESFIKAKGQGLSHRLDTFEVSLAPGEPVRLLRFVDDPNETEKWVLIELTPGPDYIAALAVEGSDWQLKCLDWPARSDMF